MAQSKLPKDIFALAEALPGLFMTENKQFHLVANTETCANVFVFIRWCPFKHFFWDSS